MINTCGMGQDCVGVGVDAPEAELFERGVDLLERIVAMLTKLIDP